MKKLISLILILCMACMLIPAMADADITGEWYLKTMKMGEQEYDAQALGVNVVLTVNADNTAGMLTPDGPDPVPGTWALDGDQLTVTFEGAAMAGTAAEDALTVEADGQVMIFTREAPVAITVADVKAAGAAEEFYGEYTLAYMDQDGKIMDLAGLGYTTGVSIGEDKFEILPANDNDMIALTVGMMALSPDGFEDGALKMKSATNPDDVHGKLELLEDGMLMLSIENTQNQATMTFYLAPAAAAEEPAA